jgi:hypothetical protein
MKNVYHVIEPNNGGKYHILCCGCLKHLKKKKMVFLCKVNIFRNAHYSSWTLINKLPLAYIKRSEQNNDLFNKFVLIVFDN